MWEDLINEFLSGKCIAFKDKGRTYYRCLVARAFLDGKTGYIVALLGPRWGVIIVQFLSDEQLQRRIEFIKSHYRNPIDPYKVLAEELFGLPITKGVFKRRVQILKVLNEQVYRRLLEAKWRC